MLYELIKEDDGTTYDCRQECFFYEIWIEDRIMVPEGFDGTIKVWEE